MNLYHKSITLILLLAGIYFPLAGEEIRLIQKNNYRVNYDMNNDEILLYTDVFLFIYVFAFNKNNKEEFLKVVDKVFEWDIIAKKNNIDNVEKMINQFQVDGYIKYGTDWYRTKKLTISFIFIYNKNMNKDTTELLIKSSKFIPDIAASDILSQPYSGLYLTLQDLKEIKQAISEENIKKVIEENKKKQEKIDQLFR